MLVLLSPAKSLDWSAVSVDLPVSEPTLDRDIGVLRRVMQRQGPDDLASLMKLSDKLAALNHDRFQAMTGDPDADAGRPAALAFNGDVYRGLDARTLSADALAWAQDHVAILSGLYGVLRPLDRIEPYRLEMGTRLKTRRGASLYDFWGDRVTREVKRRLDSQDDPAVVDLASREYSRVVDKSALGCRVVTPVFKDITDGRARIISFYAKWARGAMARYIVDHRITELAALEGFNTGGYTLDRDASTEDSWVFTRPKPDPKSAR